MTNYCQTCYFTPDPESSEDLEPSLVFKGEVVCESCAIYERHYLNQTPAERRAEHEMIQAHLEGQDRV